MSDFGILEFLLMVLMMLTELLLFANSGKANKFSCAPIVARVFLLRNCSWLLENAFLLGEQHEISSWIPGTMKEVSSGIKS